MDLPKHKLVKALAEHLVARGVDEEALDEFVVECHRIRSEDINLAGFTSQVEYLLDQGVTPNKICMEASQFSDETPVAPFELI